jgi:predicted Zn-dependent protease with MMP-like domain
MEFVVFENIFNKIVEEFPTIYTKGIHGIFLSREVKKDPSISSLYRLGEYRREPRGLGDHIVIYYGSFMIIYGHLSIDEMKEQVSHTLLHEVQHHLEHKSGIDKLGDEDRLFIANYKKKMGIKDKKNIKKDIFDIIKLLLIIVAFIAIVLYITGY